jgi:hypothetical protein
MHFLFRFFLASAAFFLVDAEPIRYRRQSGTGSSSSIVIPCPVQCSWSFAQAWTKAISFETPTANMIDDRFIDVQNGTFGAMCKLYAGYQQCLRACVATNAEYSEAIKISPTYDQVCGQKEAEFESYLPCLANNTKTYQRVCQIPNENLLAASVRLTTQGKLDSNIARDFCRTANDQSYCIFPILRQTCGDGPYDALRAIVNATFVNVRISIGEAVIEKFYPECEDYFNTIDHGIRMPIPADNRTMINETKPISIFVENATTIEVINIDSTTTSSLLILRDDANGSIYVHPTGGRLGPRLRTTTESSGSGTVNNFSNTIVIITFSFLFSIFL